MMSRGHRFAWRCGRVFDCMCTHEMMRCVLCAVPERYLTTLFTTPMPMVSFFAPRPRLPQPPLPHSISSRMYVNVCSCCFTSFSFRLFRPHPPPPLAFASV